MGPAPHNPRFNCDSDLILRDNPLEVDGSLLEELRAEIQSDHKIFASLQEDLRARAGAKMRKERPDHTLSPTALVNEAYLRVFKKTATTGRWTSDQHALNAISLAMERILLDHAASHNADKRGGKSPNRVPLDQAQAGEMSLGDAPALLDEGLLVRPEQSEEVLAVHEAMAKLAHIAPRQAKVVQLQFFAGLTQEEIAAILDVSLETVKLDWRKARGYLQLCLGQDR